MKIDNNFKKYGLYAYSEGHFTERARKMQFSGIPVLFIPGNAGSYKQGIYNRLQSQMCVIRE